MTHGLLGGCGSEHSLWLSLCICPCIIPFLVGSVEEFLYPHNVTGLLFSLLIGLKFVHHCSFYRACKSFNESLHLINSFQWLSTVNMDHFKVGDVLINVWPLHFYPSDVLPPSLWHKLFKEGLYKGASDFWILLIL